MDQHTAVPWMEFQLISTLERTWDDLLSAESMQDKRNTCDELVFFVQLRLEFCQVYTNRTVIFNCLQWLWSSRRQTTTIILQFIRCLCSKTVVKLLQVLISPYSSRPTSLCFSYLLAVFAQYNWHNNGGHSCSKRFCTEANVSYAHCHD
jgi:hypothetical protein